MDYALKILFVCSRNKIRSLTAEEIFSGIPGLQVRSAGTQTSARVFLTENHIRWADVIFVMEKMHLRKIREAFPEALLQKQLHVLHIPDDYTFMQLELIDILQFTVSQHLQLPPDA